MAHKYIFFNGPPSSGKDTACSFVYKEYPWQARHMKFATPLKEGARALYGIDQTLWDLLEKGPPEEKDRPRQEFFGKSWRQVLISLSEEHIKPQHGDDAFGVIFARQMQKATSAEFTVCSDCGFSAEVATVAKMVGPKNCFVIQIERPGCTFKDDSRSYIKAYDVPPGVTFSLLPNKFERDMFRRQVLIRVNKILGGDRTYD